MAVRRGDLASAYRGWSATYDEPRNSLFDSDEPVVHEILDRLPAGTALDAACGTGRYAAYLAGRGHRVVGVDGSAEMLDRARARVPAGTFARARPAPAAARRRRGRRRRVRAGARARAVARRRCSPSSPGCCGRAGTWWSPTSTTSWFCEARWCTHPGRRGEPGLSPTYRHTAGDYLRAALPQRLHVRRCEEPRGEMSPQAQPAELAPGDWAGWPWALLPLVPDASRAAWDQPSTIIWHFQLDDR